MSLYLTLSLDNWSVPEITGTRPEPCADVTLTSIDEQRGLFYGGRGEIRLYLIDINSMVTIFYRYRSVYMVHVGTV